MPVPICATVTVFVQHHSTASAVPYLVSHRWYLGVCQTVAERKEFVVGDSDALHQTSLHQRLQQTSQREYVC